MDKLNIIFQEERSDGQAPPLDIDEVLHGVQTRIKRRALRRKTLYSAPVVILLVMMVIVVMPDRGDESVNPGGELLMAGWEDSWTTEQGLLFESGNDVELYEQSVDYLIDENYYSYIEDAEELLDDDLKALIDYLEEV
ncbi:MAG: hypothetical protein U9Q77_05825 [Candidatus Marinimicrobia bacterium]|nr:hypothetical protein [Candidatus Neomarinimicrobiota bacterium]